MRNDLLLEFGMLMISLGGVCYDGREFVQVDFVGHVCNMIRNMIICSTRGFSHNTKHLVI